MLRTWTRRCGWLGLVLLAGLMTSCGDNPAGGGTPCDHLDVDGLAVSQGTNLMAAQWQGTVTGGLTVAPGASVDDLIVTWINADSTAVVFPPGCDLGFELRWTIANSGIAEIMPGTGKWSFAVRGLSAGMTTVRLRLWHGDHADFSSLEIPIQVTTATTVEPQALWILEGCNPLATWGYDESNGPALATGPILVAPGAVRDGLRVEFLSDVEDADGIRAALSLDAAYALAWTIADESVARVVASGGDPWSVDVRGVATGATSAQFQLRRGDRLVYTSGAIPIQVAGPPAENPDLVLRKNGIWTVIVQGGNVVTNACARDANPGAMTAAAGELTDLYSLRLLDGGCATSTLNGAATLHFEFEDPCLGRVVNHPIHWGEISIFHLQGLQAGTTQVRITALLHGAIQFVTPPIPVVVTPPAVEAMQRG